MSETETTRRGFVAAVLAGLGGAAVLHEDSTETVGGGLFPESDILDAIAGYRVSPEENPYRAVRFDADGAVNMEHETAIRFNGESYE